MESVRADEARFRAFRCFFVIEAFLAQQKVSRQGGWTGACEGVAIIFCLHRRLSS